MIDLDAVRVGLHSIITDDSAGVPVQYENSKNSTELEEAIKDKKSWIRLVIRESDAVGATIGNTMRRYPGIAMVSIFIPLETGTKDMRVIASRITNLIVSAKIPNVLVFTPTFAIIGKTEDWFQGNLSIPFHNDQFT